MDETRTSEDQNQGTSGYIISTEKFEGPLELLWSLIKKAKIDITEISISLITEQYLEYLKLMEEKNIGIATEFIVMASELIYYKSRALLPGSEMEDEYFVPPLPPDLIQKLLEYKKYQNASAALRDKFETQSDSFIRKNVYEDFCDDLYIEVSLFDLLNAFAEVMDAQEVIEQEEILFDEILVSDRIRHITDLLVKRDQVLFTELFAEKPKRPEVIATFLAILEMSKIGRIRLMQHRIYGEIRLFRNFDPATIVIE